MIQMFPQFQSESSTYFVEEDIPQGDSAVVLIPAACGACSFDIDTKGQAVQFSIYVTNASFQDASNDTDNVLWHPTAYDNVTKDLFVTVTAMAGAYKIICTKGTINVKFRGK